MSKLVMTLENGIEKRELTFNGETYDFSMIPFGSGGSKGDKPGFHTQYRLKYPDCHEDIFNLLDRLSFEESGDILDTLEELDDWEGDLEEEG